MGFNCIILILGCKDPVSAEAASPCLKTWSSIPSHFFHRFGLYTHAKKMLEEIIRIVISFILIHKPWPPCQRAWWLYATAATGVSWSLSDFQPNTPSLIKTLDCFLKLLKLLLLEFQLLGAVQSDWVPSGPSLPMFSKDCQGYFAPRVFYILCSIDRLSSL